MKNPQPQTVPGAPMPEAASTFTFPILRWKWALVLAVLLPPWVSHADTFIWDGSSSGYWGTGANWQSGLVPGNGDDLVFPAGPTRLATTNNLANRRFRSIAIGGSDYVLRGIGSGASITLSNGLSAQYAAGSSTVELDVILGADQIFECTTSTADLYVTGDLDLGSHELTTQGAGRVRLGGVLRGTGGLTKNGSGTHWLYGPSPNTHSGITRVNNGTLMLAKSGGNAVAAGELIVGDGLGGADADIVREQGNFQIGTIPITINSSGWLDLDDYNDTVGPLTFNAGHASTVTGVLTLGGDVTVLANSTPAILGGYVSLGSVTRTFDVAQGTVSPCLRLAATVSDSGSGAGIIKTGRGNVWVFGANTYRGLTTINDGRYVLYNDSALGTADRGTTIQPDGELIAVMVNVADEEVTINTRNMTVFMGPASWSGPMILNTNVLIGVGDPGQTITFSGTISGPGSLTKSGPAILALTGSAANTYGGGTWVEEGELRMGKTSGNAVPHMLSIGTSSGAEHSVVVRNLRSAQCDTVVVNASGLYDLNGFNETLGSLTLNGGGDVQTGAGTLALSTASPLLVEPGTVTNASAGISGRLNVGTGQRTLSIGQGLYTGLNLADLLIDAVVSGSAEIIKEGSGELQFDAANTFTGQLTINTGGVRMNHEQALGATTGGTVVNTGAYLQLHDSGMAVGTEPLTLNGPGVGPGSVLAALYNPVGSNAWAGDITLATDARIGVGFSEYGFLQLSGVISGPGGFTKVNSGTLILAGTSGNTYAGPTVVEEGRLDLAKTAGSGVAIRYGSLTVGDGVGGADADGVRFRADNQLWSAVPITIASSGLLDLNGYMDTVGALTFMGGRATSGPGGLMHLIHTVTSTNGSGTLQGHVAMAGTRTFHCAEPSGANLYVQAQVSGTGGMTKTGPGQLYLSSSNSYEGLTTISEGRVYADDDYSLGATTAGTVVNDGTALVLRFNVHVGNEALTVSGHGYSTLGVLASIYGSNSWAGPITLAGPTRLTTLQAEDVLHLGGAISGNGPLTLEGAGTIIFSGLNANTYTGTTRVNAGTLVLNKAGANGAVPGDLEIGDGLGGASADVVRLAASTQIANSADVTLGSSGLLDMNDRGDAINGLAGTGEVQLGSGFLNVGLSGGSSTFDGVIAGSGTIRKLGAGTITFQGANTYTGATSVEAGQLVVNGSQPGSAMNVAANGTLAGTGTVGPITSTGGTLKPGTSPGILRGGTLTLDSASRLEIELAGLIPGLAHDQLSIAGDVNLSNAALSLNLAGLVPSVGDPFVILNNDGSDAVTGQFQGLPDGLVFTHGNAQWQIQYDGGTGNDVVLTVVGVALDAGPARVTTGNGNGVVDPNECNLLYLVVTNTATASVRGIQASLTSSSPDVLIHQAESAYPDILAGGTGTNLDAFQFSTLPTLPCGLFVEFELTVNSTSHGSFVVRFAVPTGSPGAARHFDHTAELPIPDEGTLSAPLTVAGIIAPLAEVRVSLHITHGAVGHLDLSLVGPDGTTVDLSSDNGGTLDDYGVSCLPTDRTEFTDSARKAIADGEPPFQGAFRPEEPLAAFVGKEGTAVNGTWHLRVTDDTARSLGTLHCWSLFLAPATCAAGDGPCLPCPGQVIHGAIASGDPGLRRVLILNGTPGTCRTPKPCPGYNDLPFPSEYHYDAYAFQNGASNACVTVQLEALDGRGRLFSAAYQDAFDPARPCTNFLADAGVAGSSTYSFRVAPGAVFVVTVMDLLSPTLGPDYTLRVTGGSCAPWLDIHRAGTGRVRLTWPTFAPGHRLESTGSLDPLAPPIWIPQGPPPVVIDSQYTVTNTTTFTPMRYYRLHQP